METGGLQRGQAVPGSQLPLLWGAVLRLADFLTGSNWGAGLGLGWGSPPVAPLPPLTGEVHSPPGGGGRGAAEPVTLMSLAHCVTLGDSLHPSGPSYSLLNTGADITLFPSEDCFLEQMRK